jgi:cyclopropane-fatty-acyl-phospholipid synthase
VHRTQKEHIDAECRRRGITNLTIITADINEFQPPKPGSYDRIVSIEMFEHMKNYQARAPTPPSPLLLTRDIK